jgi:hypothetical protein
MKQLQLSPRMLSTLTETVDILRQALETRQTARKLSEGIMGWVWLCLQCHVASIAIELPDQAWVCCEGAWSGERYGVVGTPETTGTAEGW